MKNKLHYILPIFIVFLIWTGRGRPSASTVAEDFTTKSNSITIGTNDTVYVPINPGLCEINFGFNSKIQSADLSNNNFSYKINNTMSGKTRHDNAEVLHILWVGKDSGNRNGVLIVKTHERLFKFFLVAVKDIKTPLFIVDTTKTFK
jgi:hypothetical protein